MTDLLITIVVEFYKDRMEEHLDSPGYVKKDVITDKIQFDFVIQESLENFGSVIIEQCVSAFVRTILHIKIYEYLKEWKWKYWIDTA